MAHYEVTAVARTNQPSGPPTLVEVDRIPAGGLSWTHELNRPGAVNLGVHVDSMSDDVKLRLRDLAARPLEVWMYRDGDIVQAGPVTGWQVQESTLTLTVPGLVAYTRYMFVDADMVLGNVDQHEIVRQLVDQWQSLAYGHYGLDTTAIAASGVTRDRTYLRDEHVEVYRALELLTGVRGGFDLHVDPASREVRCDHPQRGTDLSGTVHLDRRNITSARLQASVAPGDVASESYAVGTSMDDPVSSVAANIGLRESFGRCAVAESFDGVTSQATIDDYAAELLAPRGAMLLVPGPGLIPVAGADVGDFGVGDTVEFSFDAGLGQITGDYRVAKLQVSVDRNGAESMAVEFV